MNFGDPLMVKLPARSGQTEEPLGVIEIPARWWTGFRLGVKQGEIKFARAKRDPEPTEKP